ncbi:putative chromatin structure remodeling complex protein RSC3 [Aspergillus lucknowensis]|uniref:Zn(2)-C6 fungal-type domain-containing protein n=1 Tax=Aspergillus lucknowensis TaxID=176173 RepID=A0ABR4L8E1_9EURO
MAALRKNGQLPSCEPCRTSKLRCDHSAPICQRCIARQRPDQCVYHPCPLTKPQQNRQRKEQVRTKRKSTAADSNETEPGTDLYEWASKAPSTRGFGPKQSHKEGDGSFSPSGFLGPTSQLRDFMEQFRHHGSQSGSLGENTTDAVDPRDVELGAQILSLLEHIPFYTEVLELRFKLFDGILFGPQLVRETVRRLNILYRDAIRGSNANSRQARLSEWSRTLFQNTAAAIETHPEMTVSEYISSIASRWDMIGFIFALVGRSSYQISRNAAVLERDGMPGKHKHGFRKIIMAASDMCLQFTHKLGVISDPLAWATIQHNSFLSHMHGSTDYRSWQSLGEIVSLVFALGLHQDRVDERAPFFLSEIRCRTMISAYCIDKELSTFLGRPPRICRRYCNLQPPLDLGWEDLIADAPVRDAAVQRLGPDGWDPQDYAGNECSRPRVALLASILREMILEVSLSYDIDDLQDMVKKIRIESNQLRLGLPAYLQWPPENKTTHLSAASWHLEFLYQDLLLSQTVAKRTGQTPDSLIDTSREILALLLDIVSRQARAGNVNYLICCDLCHIGLPAAGVLSKELLRQHAQPQVPGSTPFPRSEVIQHLSVFSAQLETFFPDREGEYDTLMKGLQFIRFVLDTVLSPSTTSTLPQLDKESGDDVHIPQRVPLPLPLPLQSHGAQSSVPGTQGVDDAQGLDFGAFWEDFEFDWEGDRRVLFG